MVYFRVKKLIHFNKTLNKISFGFIARDLVTRNFLSDYQHGLTLVRYHTLANHNVDQRVKLTEEFNNILSQAEEQKLYYFMKDVKEYRSHFHLAYLGVLSKSQQTFN